MSLISYTPGYPSPAVGSRTSSDSDRTCLQLPIFWVILKTADSWSILKSLAKIKYTVRPIISTLVDSPISGKVLVVSKTN